MGTTGLQPCQEVRCPDREAVVTPAPAASPSAQAKAAAAQLGVRYWNWGKKILCPTVEVVREKVTGCI